MPKGTTIMTYSGCPKCGGTGWYKYDHNHSTVCPMCCKHRKGYWLLTEWYDGYVVGDEWCCLNGCGHIVGKVDLTDFYIKTIHNGNGTGFDQLHAIPTNFVK